MTWLQRARTGVVAGVIAASTLLSLPLRVAADTTAQLCDPDPKYYCAYVEYTNQGTYYDSVVHRYKGAIDGGADWWQYWWGNDWWYNGSWLLVRDYGPSSWENNLFLGNFVGVGGASINQYAAVQMRIAYAQWQPSTSTWRYWCSPGLEFHLEDNRAIA